VVISFSLAHSANKSKTPFLEKGATLTIDVTSRRASGGATTLVILDALETNH
jgi:hypothetical protein